MTYTTLAVTAVAAAVVLDVAVLRTGLVRRRVYWTAYAIVVLFQLVVNGLFSGLDIINYAPEAILGPRVVHAPVEDLLFGFALVTTTLSTWVWLGRRSHRAEMTSKDRSQCRATSKTGPNDAGH